jgi:hypothetical protein
VAVSHIKSSTIGDFTGTVTVHNSTGGTATVAATNLVRPSDWNSGHAQLYTLSGNTTGASTGSGTNVVYQVNAPLNASANGATIVLGRQTLSGLDQFGPAAEIVYGQQGAGTLHVAPLNNHGNPFQFDRVLIPVQFSNASNSSNSFTISAAVGIYTLNGSTLSTLASTSISTNFTASGTAGSYSLWGGPRNLTIPWTTTIGGGSNLWQGVWSRTTTGGGAGMTLNMGLVSQPNSNFSGVLGAASNASLQPVLGFGIYGSSSTALPVSVPISTVQGTQSIGQRVPIVIFASGTV